MSSKEKPSTGVQALASKMSETLGPALCTTSRSARPERGSIWVAARGGVAPRGLPSRDERLGSGAARRSGAPSELPEGDQERTTQGFGRAPQELVAHGVDREVLGAEAELADPPEGDAQGAGHGRRGEPGEGGRLVVLDEIHPLVAGAERVLDLREGYVLRELQGEGLAVGAHGADAHAHAVDGHLRVQAEDLVPIGLPLPLLVGLATVDGAVDPWDEAAGERRAELTLREGLAEHQVDDLAIELEDAGARTGGCWLGHEHGH